MNVKEIRELVRLLAGTDVTELNLETEGLKITIKKGYPPQAVSYIPTPTPSPVPVPANAPAPAPVPAPPVEVTPTVEERVLGPNQVYIVAPMVGTFYRAPSPEAEPYVRVGDIVEPGQVLCIIEAMKLMNEIESEWRGRITEILVENAQPVEYGQPLFVLEKM
ncbi:MAG: acetyl-CoA carboxylase biotin carboxyl carrier protein [Firmicutes bacterium]|nr:acetyl-CoA carboxylase biotin carboxyl carrier protein [Bacillota bacterium]